MVQEIFIWLKYQSWLYRVDLCFMTSKSIGIFGVAKMALKIFKVSGRLGHLGIGNYGWGVEPLGHWDNGTLEKWEVGVL